MFERQILPFLRFRRCPNAKDPIAKDYELSNSVTMPLPAIKRLLHRWSNQNEAALWQISNRRTVGRRLAAYGKSERVEAKFFLTAMAPVIPLMVSDKLGWERGLVWKTWMCLSIAWAGGIMIVMFAGLWRAIRRSVRNQRKGS